MHPRLPNFYNRSGPHQHLHSFPTRRSSDLGTRSWTASTIMKARSRSASSANMSAFRTPTRASAKPWRSEEDTSELHHMSISYAVFCLKKKIRDTTNITQCVHVRLVKSHISH